MSHFDMTQGDLDTSLVSPISDQDGPIVLSLAQDSVEILWWFDGDLAAVRRRAALIQQEAPAIVGYAIQVGDLNGSGVLFVQWELDIVSRGGKWTTFPSRYDVARLIGP